MTDGMLLREALLDNKLSKYRVGGWALRRRGPRGAEEQAGMRRVTNLGNPSPPRPLIPPLTQWPMHSSS